MYLICRQFQILGSTAGKEVRSAIDASGEPPVHQLQTWYDNDNVEPSSSAEFWELCNQRDQYRSEYNKYWTSTREKNVAKRQVDGVIMPVAPSAAVEEGCFNYYSKPSLLSCPIPVRLPIKSLKATQALSTFSTTHQAAFPSPLQTDLSMSRHLTIYP